MLTRHKLHLAKQEKNADLEGIRICLKAFKKYSF